MKLIEEKVRPTCEAMSRLGYGNPFGAERIASEREVLGPDFIWTDDAWHKRADLDGVPPNIDLMTDRARDLADALRARALEGATASDHDWQVYEDIVLYYVYNAHQASFHAFVEDHLVGRIGGTAPAPFYDAFREDMTHYLGLPNRSFASLDDLPHMFACFFQLRRAFHFIFENIIGGSMAAARLRETVWQSIFTHDMRRYRRSLYKRMGEVATLITGPSGTGKELVAQSIAMARFIPFRESTRSFQGDFLESMHALNLSAMSPTLIESELFGHRKGSFTGAIGDRRGWFEMCPPLGTVFLDEIGEIDETLQVKLLRVLETRQFHPIGGEETLTFEGKVVAATNRNLAEEMQGGAFRHDLYYRLCSDLIVTPSLREQIAESDVHFENLVLFLCRRVAGEEEASALATNVLTWIASDLPPDYAWPGNMRELEQCVRNVMIRGAYRPPERTAASAHDRISRELLDGALSHEELLNRYYTLVYAQTGNYQEAGRQLGVDRRTVKQYVDPVLLAELR